MARKRKKDPLQEYLENASLSDLQAYRKKLARRMNDRIRAFEKAGLGNVISGRTRHSRVFLTAFGRFKQSGKSDDRAFLEGEIAELKYQLDRRTGTVSMYTKEAKARADALMKYGKFSDKETALKFSEFMGTERYSELTQEWSSEFLMEEIERVGNIFENSADIQNAFDAWLSENDNVPFEDILRDMGKIK